VAYERLIAASSVGRARDKATQSLDLPTFLVSNLYRGFEIGRRETSAAPLPTSALNTSIPFSPLKLIGIFEAFEAGKLANSPTRRTRLLNPLQVL
jgi:hypothetical protein